MMMDVCDQNDGKASLANGATGEPEPVKKEEVEDVTCKAKVIKSIVCSPAERETFIRRVLHSASLEMDLDLAGGTWVRAAWGLALVDALPPKDWLAMWDRKASRRDVDQNTASVGIDELLYVDVQANCQWSDMTARVTLLTASENMEEGDERVVSLTELFPVFEESPGGGGDQHERKEAERAAAVLDHLRFFWRYIWRPWDEEEEDAAEELEEGAKLHQRMVLWSQRLDAAGGGRQRWLKTLELQEKFLRLKDEAEEIEEATMRSSSADPAAEINREALWRQMELEEQEKKVRRNLSGNMSHIGNHFTSYSLCRSSAKRLLSRTPR